MIDRIQMHFTRNRLDALPVFELVLISNSAPLTI